MNHSTRRLAVLLNILFTLSALLMGAAPLGTPTSNPPLVNWSAPATYTPARASSGALSLSKEAEIGAGPFLFFPVTPCRQYDWRNSTPLPDNTPRSVSYSGAPCGIPLVSLALSVNITVFNIIGAPGNGVFRAGIVTASPPPAWINFPPGETQRANAGIMSTDGSGNIIVQLNMGAGQVDFTVDVNGYYYNGNSAVNAMPIGDSVDLLGFRPGGPILYAENGDLSAENAYGLQGRSRSPGAGSAGVDGVGLVFGVKGLTELALAGTAGVYGFDRRSDLDTSGVSTSAGVFGATEAGYGVVGKAGTLGIGVAGLQIDTAGALVSAGFLAYSDTVGVFFQNGLAGTGPKSFVEPHPRDATKLIKYVSIEGPEAGVYFRGRARAHRGLATIEVPEDFRIVAAEEGLSIQVTPIGEMANVAVAQIDLNRIVIKTSRDVDFFYSVNGVRRAYPTWNPIQENRKEFVPEGPGATLPEYLSADEKQRLIENGTYNADGTVNMRTAERIGWAKMWADRQAQVEAAARETQKGVSVRQR